VHILLAAISLPCLMSGWLGLPAGQFMKLNHEAHWWAFVTDAFWSASSEQLARNVFLTYMFGRVVQNTESSRALWLVYLLSAVGMCPHR